MNESKTKSLNEQWILPQEIKSAICDELSAANGVTSGKQVWIMILPSEACQRFADWAAKDVMRLHHLSWDNFLKDDLRQEILMYISVSFNRNDPHVDWSKSPTLWLAQCLVNAGFATMRKRSFQSLSGIEFDAGGDKASGVPSGETLECDEQSISIKLAVSQLNSRERLAIEMRHFTDPPCSLKEIASQIKVKTPSAVYKILDTAYEKLRHVLGGAQA